MSLPTPEQALRMLADYAEAAQRHYDAHEAGAYDHRLEHDYGCKRDEIEFLNPALLRSQADALARAQEREAGLREALECIEENDDGWARDFARAALASAGQEGAEG